MLQSVFGGFRRQRRFMSEFDLESFVHAPSLQQLKSLKKFQLQQIAKHFKLDFTTATRKDELSCLITEHLIDEELVSDTEEPADDPLSPVVDSSVVELKCLKLQDQEQEQEANLKLRELEVREKELLLQLKLRELERATTASSTSPPPAGPAAPFDISKHIRIVPPFQEKEVDKYFLHFEKVATSLTWPKEVWMVLLQIVLVGKAREVYSAMSVEQSGQYDYVKQAVLKAYELVPEAYQHNFQNHKIQDKQTYVTGFWKIIHMGANGTVNI